TVDGKGFVAENDVVKFLKDQLGYQRPYMLVQAEFYGLWLTYLFPYHGIPAFNVTQMRMPEDYKQFLGRVGNQPLKMWRMAAISYVMGPGPYLGQLQRDASSQGKFDVAFAFNAFGEPGGGVLAVAGSQQRPGEHGIMRYRDAGQRFQLIAGWENVEPEQAIERISAADYVPLNKVLLSGPGSESQPASTGEGPVGSVEVESYRAGKMVLRVSTDHKAILRVADKYEKWWSATLDGKPLPVFRCDYLFIGIPVEPGMHTITVQYKPSLTTFWSQVLGMILCVGALAMVLVRRR
ncbi:MAG TPA: YfhO family protein, partial [Kiritimatiellia bacterium]